MNHTDSKKIATKNQRVFYALKIPVIHFFTLYATMHVYSSYAHHYKREKRGMFGAVSEAWNEYWLMMIDVR